MSLAVDQEPSLVIDQTILPRNAVISFRWLIEEKIGRGGFGEVYRCKDIISKKHFALKAVSTKVSKRGINELNKEAKVLRALQGKNFFARYCVYKRLLLHNVLIMELLGKDLRKLKKTKSDKKFSINSTLSMGRMMLKAVEWLHEAGYLHRDIKPSNFAIGLGERAERVYLIDFGLAKQYVHETGEERSVKNKVLFKGTAQYSSANALLGKDPGRRDDLISLFYTLVDLSIRHLPWRGEASHKKLAAVKKSYDHSTLVSNFPAAFLQFFEHLSSLGTLETPDYGFLLLTLETCLRESQHDRFIKGETDGTIQETDHFSDHSLSSQRKSCETTITGEATSESEFAVLIN